MKKPRPNKFKAKRTPYNGAIYDSGMESRYAVYLDERLRRGEIKDWVRQVHIPIVVENIHIADYVIDFVVTNLDGTHENIEVKGKKEAVWRLKWKLVHALFPHFKFVLVTKKEMPRYKRSA